MTISWEKTNLSAEELEELYRLEEHDSHSLSLLRVFTVCLCGIAFGLIVWGLSQ